LGDWQAAFETPKGRVSLLGGREERVTGKEGGRMQPLAVIGTSIKLPHGINTREELYRRVLEKQQMSTDMHQSGRHPKCGFDLAKSGDPWRIQNQYAMSFNREEVENFDGDFFHHTSEYIKNGPAIAIHSWRSSGYSIAASHGNFDRPRSHDGMADLTTNVFFLSPGKLLQKANVEEVSLFHN